MNKNFHTITGIVVSTLIAVLLVGCNQHSKKSSEAESNYYTEKHRPQFHFSPEANWMNDPNGMVYYEGEYHLFYQYYPDSTVWGPMHWGHAISKDLIHWEHLPIALYPDSLGLIFSGSAVIDWNNTTGFGSKENPPMVAIFTYHNMEGEKTGRNDFQTQGIAYSLDKGRTWTKYSGNPVLPNPGIRDFRDPKVSWNKEMNKWIMVFAAHDRVKFYSSSNLKEWTHASDFGMELGAHSGVWECPDLYPIKVEGSDETKWILMVSINPGGPNGGSATQYFVGNFDGRSFIPEIEGTNWVDWGRDNYAGVTWSDIPASDGRRLFLGWMSNWDYANVVPTTIWRSTMTFPREIKLKKVDGKFLLTSIPVKELELIREPNTSSTIQSETISGEKEIDLNGVNLSQCEIIIDLAFEKEVPESFGLVLENSLNETVKIGYSKSESKFFIDRTNGGKYDFSDKFTGTAWAPYAIKNQVQLHLLVDAASVELFVDEGDLVMTELLFPTEKFNKLSVFAENGKIELKSGSLISLNGIWKK